MSSANNSTVPVRLHAITVRAEIVICGTILVYLTLPFVIWLVPGLAEHLIQNRMGAVVAPQQITWLGRLEGCAASMLYALPLAFGLSRIALLFRTIRLGNPFQMQTVRCVRQLGFSLIAAALALPMARLLVLHAVGAPAQLKQLLGIFSPGFAVLSYLILGFALTVLASVLKEAVRLSEENARFI